MPTHLPIRCVRCHDQGYLTKPCPLCGALRIRGGSGVAYQVGTIFGGQAPAVAPKRSRPDW